MAFSLTAEKLACARGDRVLFQDLSFRVTAGQALAIEGANGSGKTSLLRLIAGFLSPRAGRLLLRTDSGESDSADDRAQVIGWLGHQDGQKPQLTAHEQLKFFARLYRSTHDATAVLDEVGLVRQKDLLCRYLSAGQKRRLALACLIISARPLWLLDEPFAALDSDGCVLVRRLMILHCGQGGMIVAATHDPLGLGNQVLKL